MHKSIKIADTTREERIEIIKNSLSYGEDSCEGGLGFDIMFQRSYLYKAALKGVVTKAVLQKIALEGVVLKTFHRQIALRPCYIKAFLAGVCP